MSRALYSILLLLATPAIVLRLLWRARKQPAYLDHWGERLGFYGPAASAPVVWLHAVSVGETRAAQPLVEILRLRYPDHRILFTHMTATGRQTSRDLFGSQADRVYLPYDSPWAVRRFLRHFRPRFGLIMETELWPNLIAACRALGTPLLLVNARMSDKSARLYARWPQLTRTALRDLTAIAARGEEDAARLTSLGAREVTVVGNLKFDITPPPGQLTLGSNLRDLWGSGLRPVLLAASTREGEEALLLDALLARPIANLLLVIVPRHPQRFDEVASLVAQRGMRLKRRSEGRRIAAETHVVLGDSMGEMFAYYAASDVAFIGGSLLDYGSQNLIEACAVGVPLLLGPSVYNFAEAAQAALACGAARPVENAPALLVAAAELLGNAEARRRMGAAGQAFVAQHRGASARTLALLEGVLANKQIKRQ
jgi:3-deoxy-D-manno-octulosonic-acid transferase